MVMRIGSGFSALPLITQPPVEFYLYPNPSASALSINTNGIEVKTTNIYNATGALVFPNYTLTNNQLSIAHLQNGIYFLEINTNEGIGRKRFVKM